MDSHHKTLTLERWQSFGLDKMFLNIISELIRVKSLAKERNLPFANQSLERALELTDLTIQAKPQSPSVFFLKELLRWRDVLAEYYISDEKNEAEIIQIIKTFLSLNSSAYNLGLEI